MPREVAASRGVKLRYFLLSNPHLSLAPHSRRLRQKFLVFFLKQPYAVLSTRRFPPLGCTLSTLERSRLLSFNAHVHGFLQRSWERLQVIIRRALPWEKQHFGLTRFSKTPLRSASHIKRLPRFMEYPFEAPRTTLSEI